MNDSRLITLAIHTLEKALPLKHLLENEGIAVELHNVNLESPETSVGVRIRIPEAELPRALRIVENIEIFAFPDSNLQGNGGRILVPVDFSPHSIEAARLAMILGARNGRTVEFIHTFLTPTNRDTIQLANVYDYDLVDMETTRQIEREARAMMTRFSDSIRNGIKSGEIPAAKFATTVCEGLPEEVILNFTREQKPQILIMGTRRAHKKEQDLIGSVTAEVLDGCRVPTITLPDSVEAGFIRHVKRVFFFCNYDQEDLIALDELNRLLPESPLQITLIHIPGRRYLRKSDIDRSEKNLLLYMRSHYPNYTVDVQHTDSDRALSHLSEQMQKEKIDLVCVPGKHKNVFARVFNPGLPHKLLFSTDIPMLMVPV